MFRPIGVDSDRKETQTKLHGSTGKHNTRTFKLKYTYKIPIKLPFKHKILICIAVICKSNSVVCLAFTSKPRHRFQ